MGLGLEYLPLHLEPQGSAPGAVTGINAVPLAPAWPVTGLGGKGRLRHCVQGLQVQLQGHLDDGDRGHGGPLGTAGAGRDEHQANGQQRERRGALSP